jgi:zinc transport system substrate-binding protein
MSRKTKEETMRMKNLKIISIILLLATAITSCASGQEATSDGLQVTVSIVPEKYFVERVGGEHVAVNVMVGPGESPHTYEPKTSQMTALSESNLYFSIGVEFEDAWMERIAAANSDMEIIDISANLDKMAMTSEHHHEGEESSEEAHEEEHEEEHHEEGNLDPHVWTSPENAKVMSETIYEALAEADPAHADEFQANLESFIEDIDKLEAEIESGLANIESTKFIVFHPAWGYFARDFGLEQIAIEIEGSEPSAQELAGIIDEAIEEDAQVVFAQPEFSTKTAEYIASEINGRVILISPLAENWLENLQIVADSFAEALGDESAQENTSDGLNVTVSIVPQKYFVERIGGEFVNVTVMVEPSSSPATYEPKPEQMTAIAQADAYVSIGVPFENAWLEKIQAANDNMKMVDTTQGIERAANDSGGFDPHIWLSPKLVKIQSETIYNALAELDPAHKDTFKTNLDAFVNDIDALDADISATLEMIESKKFIVFHPAWGYFANDYGLEMIPIEVGGQEPSAQELAGIIEVAIEENAQVIFAQPEFSTKTAEYIADEINGQVVLISPLAEDWLGNLQKVANSFAEALD